MEVYNKAVKIVPEAERLSVYDLYLARAHEFFGLGKVPIWALSPPPLHTCPIWIWPYKQCLEGFSACCPEFSFLTTGSLWEYTNDL